MCIYIYVYICVYIHMYMWITCRSWLYCITLPSTSAICLIATTHLPHHGLCQVAFHQLHHLGCGTDVVWDTNNANKDMLQIGM